MLTKFQTNDRNLSLLQSSWAADLDPLLSNPISSGLLLTGINLLTGTNVINHLLGRKQRGWVVSDQTAIATMFRSQPFNDKTLTLTVSAPVTVSLYVF